MGSALEFCGILFVSKCRYMRNLLTAMSVSSQLSALLTIEQCLWGWPPANGFIDQLPPAGGGKVVPRLLKDTS